MVARPQTVRQPTTSQGPGDLIVPGQRYVSESEPELGLGVVRRVSGRRVALEFPAAGAQREYARDGAPLRRARFRPGDAIASRQGARLTVTAVHEGGGLLSYDTVEGRSLAEADLADSLGFSTPDERLLGGHTDGWRLFDLRRSALEHEHQRRRSAIRGFLGGRIELIPHQLFIAGEVSSRRAPRVLLADEVGLGKAIEACLIVHRLRETGRATRVLVVVPEPLLHQWLVELLRRFELRFVILDERRWEREGGRPVAGNPFEDDALVLCALPLLLNAQRARQAVAAGWDLLVVDEAHRLRWSPEQPSPEYRVVEALSRRAAGVLLVTATPEQLGLPGHFARLRLLDPARYASLAQFEKETEHYREVASVASALSGERPLTPADQKQLHSVLGDEPGPVRQRLEALARGDTEAREAVVADLLDRHGPGRAIFRNTRAVIKGFPKRLANPAPLVAPDELPDLLPRLAEEFAADVGERGPLPSHDFFLDPRLWWLVDLLRQLKGAKVLLICRTPQKVRAIHAALERHLKVRTALFHEGLELLQRDRQAAWFAEPEGAQILLASEIGSEGRNFQFAHHLVLFDLPLDPELLEQRIGRLDRIGQTESILIHVPYLEDSPQQALFHWYHDALDAFTSHLHTGRAMLDAFGDRVREVALTFGRGHRGRRRALATLVRDTREARAEQERQIAQARDRLLELGSFRPPAAAALVDGIRSLDQDGSLDDLMQQLWNHFGVAVEELASRSYFLKPEASTIESFPGLPAQGLSVTLDRRRALAREDLAFLTWDHPMVTGALDLLLGSPDGNASAAIWPEAPEPGLWLEAVHVLECVAPSRLHADRFLPAGPIRVIVDAGGTDVTARATTLLTAARLGDVSFYTLRERPPLDRPQLRHLLAASLRLAEAQRAERLAAAQREMERHLGHEQERLLALLAVNPSLRPQEIAAVEQEMAELRRHLASAHLRLDAVRLILLGTA